MLANNEYQWNDTIRASGVVHRLERERQDQICVVSWVREHELAVHSTQRLVVALTDVQAGTCLGACLVNCNPGDLHQVREWLTKGTPLIDQNLMGNAGVDFRPRVEDGLSGGVRLDVRQELRHIEVHAFVNDVEHRITVQVHNVEKYSLVESEVACTEADSKSKWCRLDPLTRSQRALISSKALRVSGVARSGRDLLIRLKSLSGDGWKNWWCNLFSWTGMKRVSFGICSGANKWLLSARTSLMLHKLTNCLAVFDDALDQSVCQYARDERVGVHRIKP